MGIMTSPSTGNWFKGTEGRSIVFQHPPQRHSAATSNSDDITAHPPFSLELGLTDDIRPVVRDWLDRLCAESANLKTFQRHRVRRIILALGDANLVVDAFRRLNLFLNTAEEVTHWLSLTGVSALDVVEHSIVNKPDYLRRIAGDMLDAFLRTADSVETVPTIFRISRRPEFASKATEWLEAHPRETVIGLVEMVSNGDPLSLEARQFLQVLKTSGHAEFLEEVLKTAAPEVAREINKTRQPDPVETIPFDEETTPDWLRQGLVYGTWNGKIPIKAVPADLPKISIGGNHFNESQVRDFLTMLHNVLSPEFKKAPHGPFFERLVHIIGHGKWEEFLWAVLDGWKQMGLKESPQGPVFSLGFWGGDFTVQQLNAKLRNWYLGGTSLPHPAAMETLRAIGTKMALSYIREYSFLPYSMAPSRDWAWATYCSLAKENNIPLHEMHELDIQTLPDCGLNPKGVRTFDFGPRKILVSITPDFRPAVSNEFGKRKKRFPKPVRKDDPQKVEIAFREWELFNEQLRLLRDVQLKEFEKAMKQRITWKAESFVRHLVGNPAMIQFCRGIVWGIFTGNGKYLKSFRVCEDNTFSDLIDRRLVLPEDGRIGIPQPSQMTYGEHHDWLQIFNDHFLTQPFPQLKS